MSRRIVLLACVLLVLTALAAWRWRGWREVARNRPAAVKPPATSHEPAADSKQAASTADGVTAEPSASANGQSEQAQSADSVDPQTMPAEIVETDSAGPPEPPDEPQPAPIAEPRWHTHYRTAMNEAVAQEKLLLIFFHERQGNPARKAFEEATLEDLRVKDQLGNFVLAKLPTTAKIKFKGEQITLLKHAAFAEMLGRQGMAIIDLAHKKTDYYGYVVSTFPFTPGKYYRPESTSIILDLPPGTLTQRTMIYAVRIHPEAPASTQGQFFPVLADEAKMASAFQAHIQVQGHHSWDSRFQRINAKLPSGLLAQEVVAESWPNESLVVACVDCVASWRQSPGHWSAVRSRHPLFGFDIKRGRNGIWYATGIFGRRWGSGM